MPKYVLWTLVLLSFDFFAWVIACNSHPNALPSKPNSLAPRPCLPRKYEGDSVVCVCNCTYCDDLPPIGQPDNATLGTYTVYRSTLDGQRYFCKNMREELAVAAMSIEEAGCARTNFQYRHLSDDPDTAFVAEQDSVTIEISNSTRQSILGFGGSFTDSTGVNFNYLSQTAQDNLLASYFSDNGIEYSVGRIPMGGCDFSMRVYTYDDQPNDFDLKAFALTPEDADLKISLIQRAKALSRNEIKLFGSPWSAPGWMKTNGNASRPGKLLGKAGNQCHKTWAQYFVRFVKAYEAQNITMWGLTAQNEPNFGLDFTYPFNGMGFTAESQRDFIAKDLGPALTAAGLRRLKLMIMDDARYLLPAWPDTVLRNSGPCPRNQSTAAEYVDGIGVHWYFNGKAPPSLLDVTHDNHPEKFLLATEACAGFLHIITGEPAVIMGDWSRAESYVHDIIENLNHWVTGWVDWNMALDLNGGPNWANNPVDSPIIVNKTADEFYKQPMFYALGHFSKFFQPDSIVLETSRYASGLPSSQHAEMVVSPMVEAVAGQRPDKGIVLVAMNKESKPIQVIVVDHRAGKGNFVDVLPPRSIQSYVWWP